MIAYTVYGMTCMFLYVEREQSVVARGERRDVLWVWNGRLAGWVKGSQPRHRCVRTRARVQLGSHGSGWFKIEPGRLPDLPAGPGVELRPIFALPRGGRFVGGAPSWRRRVKSDTLTLSEVTCQGVLTF